MRPTPTFPLLAVFTLTLALAPLSAAAPPPMALVGATLVDGTGAAPVPDAVVLVRDGRIACAGPRDACPVPEGVETRDLRGHWIVPGLIDAHVHFSQTGWADGRPDALDARDRHPYEQVQRRLRENPERYFRSYLCSGVTAVFDVGGYPWTTGLMKRTELDPAAPHVVASGPLLSTRDHWLNLPAERQFIYLADAESARTGVRYLVSRDAAAVKVWYIAEASRDPGEMASIVLAAGEAAREAGLPLIVHATELDVAKTALRAGAKLLVHSVEDQPVDEEFLELALANGTVYNPTLTVMDGYVRMFDAAAERVPPEVDDPGACVDAGTLARVAESATVEPPPGFAVARERRAERMERARQVTGANLLHVHAAGIPVAMGTDAGNPLTLHGPSVYAEMEAMQAAGLRPIDVLVASTRNAALAMGRLDDLGTVEAGKIADLIVVAGDPTADIANLRQLRHVVRGGAWWDQESLRRDAGR
jgi:imidazolonepropionase-like amidohydrolase